MNKNLFKTLCLMLVFSFTRFFASEPPKVPLQKVFAITKLAQEKVNKFWFDLYDFEQDRIINLIAIKKKSTKNKLTIIKNASDPSTASSIPSETFNRKIKKGIYYCLPTIASAGISIGGLYYANKNLYDDSSGLKSLVYSCAVFISSGYYCLNYTLPSFKKGIYSLLYKSISYKDYLNAKLEEIKNASTKIKATSTEDQQTINFI